jgi:tRNA(Ile)-lysidine synthase
LLTQWLDDIGADHLATAHHLDDQAETLLMRLLRGSGLSGLAAIRAVNAPIVRPLLGWRRRELLRLVSAAGIAPVCDPSNEDERFDRVAIRRRLAECDWLDPEPLAASAAALAQADESIRWVVERLRSERITATPDGFSFDPAGLPAELRRRLILAVLASMGRPAPRGDDVTRLLATLEAGGTATLAGVKCAGGGSWRFSPAPPRR